MNIARQPTQEWDLIAEGEDDPHHDYYQPYDYQRLAHELRFRPSPHDE